MKDILAIFATGFWLLGVAADSTEIGTVVQIAATLLIGVIGFLIRLSIGQMQKSIEDQGKRIRAAELNVVRIASRRGISLPNPDDEDEE